jgi:hypothetical protein
MLLPVYKVLPKLIDTFDKKIKQLGKIPPEIRMRALEAAKVKSMPVFGPKGSAGALDAADR